MVVNDKQAFEQLGPDQVLNAIEEVGYICNGRLLALNSYENRVYQVGIEDQSPLIAKFYRPGRWTDEAILEEHQFAQALADLEVPVVAPLLKSGHTTLFHHGPYRFALFPQRGGRAPGLDNPEHLVQLGRLLARLHNLGAAKSFKHRLVLGIEHFGQASKDFLLAQDFIPPALQTSYDTLTDDCLQRIQQQFSLAGDVRMIRLHGDCHAGNILWNESGPHIVDLDDACMGPAIQDLWMFLSGDRDYMTARLADILDGYSEFREFDARELHLVEALRTLRMLYYAAWLARRWDDPAFPRAFPWFNTPRYWDEHILSLREQAALLDEPALVWN